MAQWECKNYCFCYFQLEDTHTITIVQSVRHHHTDTQDMTPDKHTSTIEARHHCSALSSSLQLSCLSQDAASDERYSNDTHQRSHCQYGDITHTCMHLTVVEQYSHLPRTAHPPCDGPIQVNRGWRTSIQFFMTVRQQNRHLLILVSRANSLSIFYHTFYYC